MRGTVAGTIFALMGLMHGALAQPAPAPATTPAPAVPRIDLKLFETAEIDRSKGCTFVLWQDNRDPDKDRYAYAFAETLGRNHVRENARIRVGSETLTFRRIAVGGAKEFGYKSFPYQLYKMDKEDSFLILDLKLQDEPGEVVDVTSGTLTIVRPKLPPFAVSVKGNAGCNTPAASASAPPPQKAPAIEPPGMFEKYAVRPASVPANLKRNAKQKFQCSDKAMSGTFNGYQMSEESALWEIPCEYYAGQMTYVYALVHVLDPATQHTFRTFDAPKGTSRIGLPGTLFGPVWDLKTRTVTSITLEGANDCGIYERHQVTNEGTFALVEFREKTMCDGKKMPPKDFPLIFRR